MEKANPTLTASYSTSLAKLSFQKSAPVTPSSVDQASFQGRCQTVAVATAQAGRVFTVTALFIVAKNIYTDLQKKAV